MLINVCVGIFLVDFSIVVVKLTSCLAGTGGRDDDNVGIFSLDSLIYYVETLPKLLALILVAHTEVFEVERRGMSHFGTQLTPLGVNIAIAKLNQVEGVLYKNIVKTLTVGIGVERRNIRMTHKLTRYAIVEHRQRTCAKSLRHKEILIKTNILRGPVTPVIAKSETLLRLSYAVFPKHLSKIVGTF